MKRCIIFLLLGLAVALLSLMVTSSSADLPRFTGPLPSEKITITGVTYSWKDGQSVPVGNVSILVARVAGGPGVRGEKQPAFEKDIDRGSILDLPPLFGTKEADQNKAPASSDGDGKFKIMVSKGAPVCLMFAKRGHVSVPVMFQRGDCDEIVLYPTLVSSTEGELTPWADRMKELERKLKPDRD